MAGPWEQYQQPSQPVPGPWIQYGRPAPQEPQRPAGNVNEFRGNPMDLLGEVGNMWLQDIAETPERAATFTENAIEGVPVAGPLAMSGMDNTAANIRSMITGQPAADELAGIQAGADQRAVDHSEAALAGQITGAVGPLAALGTTAAGGRALGMSGPLWQRMLAGGASGAVIAGGDTAARGGNLAESTGMGALGLGMGAVFPLAERALSPIARMITGAQAPTREASVMNRALTRDNIDPADLPRLLDEMGPDAMPVDLGTNLSRQAGGIAALPEEGASILRDALGSRNALTNFRIQAATGDILGPAPVPSALQTEIRSGQQALQPEYRALLDSPNVRAVDTTPLAETLDAWAVSERGKGQQVATEIRRMLNVAGEDALDPNPSTLLSTRQAIDGMLASETNTNAIRILTAARQQVDDMLGRSVPGIKDVDARFQELARQGEAVQTGQQLLDSGRTATRPQELEQMMQQQGVIMGPTGVPFRLTQGARAEIDRLVGTTANNLTALKSALKGDGSWNRDRLVTLFGQDKADQLLGVLEREMAFNRSFNTVTQNSETAARQAAIQDVSPAQFGERPMGIMDLLLRVPQGLANAGARTRSESVNKLLAEMLTNPPTGQQVDQLIAANAASKRRGLIAPASLPLLTNSGGGGSW